MAEEITTGPSRKSRRRAGGGHSARLAARDLLSSHYPEYIDRSTEKKIRDKYPILLPREAMSAASGRW